MSRSLVGLVIDTLEFAREGRSVTGTVPLSSLSRVFELLGESALRVQTLDCELNGRRDKQGCYWLRLQVRGTFDLTCQRCLGPFPYVLDIDTELQVIPPGAEWPDEVLEDGALSLGPDAIAADPALSVAGLIEEEVLLALPVAPRHEAEQENGIETCVPPVRTDDKQAASPFAVLAQLKKH